jgi:hypothetical protein
LGNANSESPDHSKLERTKAK